MPQFVEFPHLPADKPELAVDALIRVCREWPIAGEPFSAFRKRLKTAKLWHRERLGALLRFIHVAEGEPVMPSEFVLAFAEAADDEAARDHIATRLWAVNPVLCKVVIDRLDERVHTRNELLKFLDSYAYPGTRVSGTHVRAWFDWAAGLSLIKSVGVGLGLAPRGKAFVARAKALDLEEFFEDDDDEPLPPILEPPTSPISTPAPAMTVAAANPVPASIPPPLRDPTATTLMPIAEPSPWPAARGRGVAISAHRFDTTGVFADDVCDDNATRIASWWSEVDSGAIASMGGIGATSATEYGIGAESWQEDAEACLYRIAVAAALDVRAGAKPHDAFAELEHAGLLDALFHGVAPTGPVAAVDPQALLLASIVARRFAESPELAADLERLRTAQQAFERLDRALGRGLFGVELFWILRCMRTLGVIRLQYAEQLVALPGRAVRDVLFRLGFLSTPYAASSTALVDASTAAAKATGGGEAPDRVLTAFARSAGCDYGCPNARQCEYACRERADLT